MSSSEVHHTNWLSFKDWTLETAINDSIYLFSIISLLTLICLLFLINRLKQELIPVFSDNDGEVKITHTALHELVRNASRKIPGIFSPNTNIIRKGGGIYLKIRIQLKNNSDFKEIRSQLQTSIEQTLTKELCFKNYKGSEIIIKGFKDEN